MNTIRFQSKEAFIDALEGRRAFWRDFDRRQAREHAAAERELLVKARAKMREALRWDYPTLKANLDWSGDLKLGSRAPECPVLMEPQLDNILAALRLTQGKSFTVDTNGGWSEAHKMLTWDPDARTKAC